LNFTAKILIFIGWIDTIVVKNLIFLITFDIFIDVIWGAVLYLFGHCSK